MGKWLVVLLLVSAGAAAGGPSLAEDFSSDPLLRGWRVAGNPSLFHWNVASGTLGITWDSSQTNSYCEWPLGTVLAKEDDFDLQFDLKLDRVEAGVNPAKPFAFELAIGLFNRGQAESAGFRRGAGTQSPNLVEFDYFPDTGFGATIWPTLVASNRVFNFNGDTDYALEELPTGAWLRVLMSYRGGPHTLTTTIRREGALVATVGPVSLMSSFTDFRVDTFSVSSYSDAGADGSIRAQGELDNVQLWLPPPPLSRFVGQMNPGQWQVNFTGRTHWLYTLEWSTDLLTWQAAEPGVWGGTSPVTWQDPRAPGARGFYRVRADRP
jgi:hypothetical protein